MPRWSLVCPLGWSSVSQHRWWLSLRHSKLPLSFLKQIFPKNPPQQRFLLQAVAKTLPWQVF